MLNFNPVERETFFFFCAVVLSGRCYVPGCRSAGSLQHTSMRKACSEALMSSALSNQIVSCPLLYGRGFLCFLQIPLVEYIGFFVCFLLEIDFTVNICTPISSFELFFSLSFSENVCVICVKRSGNCFCWSFGEAEQSRTSSWAEQSFCWSWIGVKIDL